MSKYELKSAIKRELKELNWKIDMKIVRGLPYRNDARRHKILLMQLDRLTSQARSARRSGMSVFTRMAGALTSFVL